MSTTEKDFVEGQVFDHPEQGLVHLPSAPMTHEELMPALTIEQAGNRYLQLKEFITNQMVEGRDYGVIPGTKRVSLQQPGAEKLCTFQGLSPRVRCLESEEDWMGLTHGQEAFFYYRYEYALYRGDVFMGSADASCNSWEPKYRYRKGGLTCPECHAVTIIKSRPTDRYPDGGFWCGPAKGGCGTNFKHDDIRLTEQSTERTLNPDPAELVNTIQGMAQKRAYVRVVKMVTNASEFFSDIPDANGTKPTQNTGSQSQTGNRAASDNRKPQQDAEDRDRERRKALGRALAQLVKREGDICKVPSATEENVVHEVTRNPSKRLVCSCPDFKARLAELDFECEHVLAVKYFFLKANDAPKTDAKTELPKAEPPAIFTAGDLWMDTTLPADKQKDEMARGIASVAHMIVANPDGFLVKEFGYAGGKEFANKVFRDPVTREPRCMCLEFTKELEENPTNLAFRCVHMLAVHFYLLSKAEANGNGSHVSAETLERIKVLAAKATMDAEAECQSNLGCPLAELSEGRAASFIRYLETVIQKAETPF